MHPFINQKYFKILLNVWEFFIPPYSPMTNPIEEVFSFWKNYVRKFDKRNLSELINAILAGAR